MLIDVFFSSDDWLKRLMKRKEEETAREKRRVGSIPLKSYEFVSLVHQDELKVKIDLEEQYANAAKNTLAANIKKTVETDLINILFDEEFHSEARFRCQIPSSIQ